ncbi:MAG: DUF3786 domain-containing protein [Thermodesulfobacteriota bacterium]
MSNPGSIFETTYTDYLAQVNRLDLNGLAPRLGLESEPQGTVIPLLDERFSVTGAGVIDARGIRPGFDVCVMLCKYLLLCPASHPEDGEWVTYRGLKHAGPLTVFFQNEVEKAIAGFFTGRQDALQKACDTLGAEIQETDGAYDLVARFTALPRVPLLLQFNDKDDEFPAACRVLFERRAEAYLDAECLAMLGRYLFFRLKRAAGQKEKKP